MRNVHWILAATLLSATGVVSAQQAGGTDRDAARRAGYEASRAFHQDPNSRETADAIRRLIRIADGRLPAQGGKREKKRPQRDPRRHNNAAQSDAMRDALGFARQAFGYAASHPNASQADLKAQADAMMSGVFSRELDGTRAPQPKPQSQSQPQKPARDYGDADPDDNG